MKVQVYFTMEYDEVQRLKAMCRQMEMNFSEYLREATYMVGPPTMEMANYFRARRWGKFQGSFLEWQNRTIVLEYKGQHKHADGSWCGLQDCPREKVPLDF
jgi:hypothetical protein